MTKRLLGLLCVTLIWGGVAHARYDLDQPMTVERINGIDIAYTETGSSDAPPVLMVIGRVVALADAWRATSPVPFSGLGIREIVADYG